MSIFLNFKKVSFLILFQLFQLFIFEVYSLEVARNYSPYYQKEFYQGKIIKINKKEKLIYIKSTQTVFLKNESKILYLHKKDIQIPFIFKIRKIDYLRGITKAQLLHGEIEQVFINNIINNIFHWNTFEYTVKANYENETKKISIEKQMIIPNNIVIQSAFGQKSDILSMENVKKINLNYDIQEDTLKISSFILNDQTEVKPYFTHFSLNKSFPIKRKIHIQENKNLIEFSNKDLKNIEIIKKDTGIFRTLTFHHWRLDSISVSRTDNEDLSNVKIRFMSYELILFSIEKWLSDAKSEEEENTILPYLKYYDQNRIHSIYLMGSFYNWNLSDLPNSILKKSPIYPYHSTQIQLPKGLHEYYFIVHLTFDQDLKDLYVKILDPYSKVGVKQLGIICENDLKDSQFKLLENNDFLSLFEKIKYTFNSNLWSLKNISDNENNKGENQNITLNPDQLIYSLYPYEDMTSKRTIQLKNAIKVSKAEEKKPTIDDNDYKTKISIQKEPYFKVTFEFNQVYSIRKQILRKIQLYENNKDKKKYYEYLLDKFNEDNIESIYLFLKDIHTKQTYRILMAKSKKNYWSTELYLKEGIYEYQYQVDLNIKGVETYIFHEEDSDSKFSTLNLKK